MNYVEFFRFRSLTAEQMKEYQAERLLLHPIRYCASNTLAMVFPTLRRR
jgi:hypothetical protein